MWGVGGGAGACLSENTLNMKVFIARYVYPKHRAIQEYSSVILGTIITVSSATTLARLETVMPFTC